MKATQAEKNLKLATPAWRRVSLCRVPTPRDAFSGTPGSRAAAPVEILSAPSSFARPPGGTRRCAPAVAFGGLIEQTELQFPAHLVLGCNYSYARLRLSVLTIARIDSLPGASARRAWIAQVSHVYSKWTHMRNETTVSKWGIMFSDSALLPGVALPGLNTNCER